MRPTDPIAPAAVRVTVIGDVPETIVDYARDKIARASRLAGEPVLDIRVRITAHRDPAVPEPVTAQVNLDLNGRPVRARAQAPTAREVVDRLDARLRNQLARVNRGWEARRGRSPGIRRTPATPATDGIVHGAG